MQEHEEEKRMLSTSNKKHSIYYKEFEVVDRASNGLRLKIKVNIGIKCPSNLERLLCEDLVDIY
jgi:hypothetical protein